MKPFVRSLPLAFALAVGVGLASTAALAATPVVGSVAGKITAVNGARFTLTSATGTSVIVTKISTSYTKTSSGTKADLAVGACATGIGTKPKTGTAAAVLFTIAPAIKGECTGPDGFRRGQTPPGGQQPPPGQQPPGQVPNLQNRVFAEGKITAVKGSTVTVKGPSGTVSLLVGNTTRISKTASAGRSALADGSCALVRGTTVDNGKTVTAQAVMLSQSTAQGCRRPAFPGAPG